MFDFLKKPAASQQRTSASLDELLRQLMEAVEAQYLNGNITLADVQKVVNLAKNTVKLRTALTYL